MAYPQICLVLLVCVLGLGMRSGAEGAASGDVVPGTIILSTGEKICGEVFLTRGKRLRIWDLERELYRDFELKKIAQMRIKVKRQRIEKEWRFKEEGSPEKVFTGRFYPRLDFTLTLTLLNGKRVECNLVRGQPLYVQPPQGKKRRFILQPHLKGEVGQTPGLLVYPKEIVLASPGNQRQEADGNEPAGKN